LVLLLLLLLLLLLVLLLLKQSFPTAEGARGTRYEEKLNRQTDS